MVFDVGSHAGISTVCRAYAPQEVRHSRNCDSTLRHQVGSRCKAGTESSKRRPARPPSHRVTHVCNGTTAKCQSSSPDLLIGMSHLRLMWRMPPPVDARRSSFRDRAARLNRLACEAKDFGLLELRNVVGLITCMRTLAISHVWMVCDQLELRMALRTRRLTMGTCQCHCTGIEVPPGGGSRQRRKATRTLRRNVSLRPIPLMSEDAASNRMSIVGTSQAHASERMPQSTCCPTDATHITKTGQKHGRCTEPERPQFRAYL